MFIIYTLLVSLLEQICLMQNLLCYTVLSLFLDLICGHVKISRKCDCTHKIICACSLPHVQYYADDKACSSQATLQ